MSDQPAAMADLPLDFLAFYDDALAQVYGYLLARCNRTSVAEDLTAETFLAAVDAVRRDRAATVSLPWIIGVARHKLVDHWRRLTRETSGLKALVDQYPQESTDDPADAQLDAVQARETLAALAPHHQAVLTLRYLDDLPCPRSPLCSAAPSMRPRHSSPGRAGPSSAHTATVDATATPSSAGHQETSDD